MEKACQILVELLFGNIGEMATFHEKNGVDTKQKPIVSGMEGLNSDGEVSIGGLVAEGKFLDLLIRMLSVNWHKKDES